MRPLILFAAVLWLQGFLAEEGARLSLERCPDGEGGAPSAVHGLQLHSSGSAASLEASWGDAPGEKDSYQLLLYHRGSQTQAHNISVSPDILSYNLGNLLPGAIYVLEVTTWSGGLQAKTSIHQCTDDHSRVRLAQLEGKPHSDYINASFIPGYTHPREYIATQGPLKKILEYFWRLVWEQQVHTIVMLTVGMENGRVLCEPYWPACTTPVTLGRITIHLLAEEPGEEWTEKEFRLQHDAQHKQRRVRQLQFTTWPDHSVPEGPGSLLTFVELVREQVRATQGTGPILVHCRAGVGRTGTFVALLRLLQQLEEEQVVDVFNAAYALRLHRPFMIQIPSQYIFLHSCILSRILQGPFGTSETGPISVANFAQACAKRAANANAGFLKEYELLLQAIKNEADSSSPPPGYEQDSTVSWGPLGRDHVVLMGPVGPEELWELVWEHGAHVLAALSLPDTQEGESGTERLVQRLQFLRQEHGHELSATYLLPFLAAVGPCCFRGRSRKPGTLLSYCSKGAAQLGTFLAVEQLLQQAGTEQTVDVFKAALQQSQACALMIPTLEQYIYLYDCLNSALVDGLP
ncbi:Receptor-type tyrosine-protein phosphatase V [Fukomys damarensis]|uniref:protein-tyrosine-phosphatase n=1 Tax=Fukomys damarensis TaxID=885580 RepID=A0A091CX87_FUKDA|nr:Receptor-type tyrosine-protein phosphatase V [Fukomys damarensis]